MGIQGFKQTEMPTNYLLKRLPGTNFDQAYTVSTKLSIDTIICLCSIDTF